MKKTIITLILLIILAFGLSVIVKQTSSVPVEPQVSQHTSESIEGCYVATLDRDVYTLTLTDESEGVVVGTLRFKNYQKDSSSGTFAGMYENGILYGDYAFTSEGMDSVREVAFKQVPEGFVEGFGDVKNDGIRETFVDRSTVTYGSSPLFVKQASCTII